MLFRSLLVSGVLGLSLLGVNAAAACSSSTAYRVHGSANEVAAKVRRCAQLGVYLRGHEHIVETDIAGEGSRVVIGGVGRRTGTRVHVDGYDNQVGTAAYGGGKIRAAVVGDRNEMALRARNGARLKVQTYGDDNYVRVDAE